MRRIVAACAVIFQFGLAGCVTSLQPLYRAQDLVFDPVLVGEWISDRDSWTITRTGSGSYRVILSDDTGRSGTFIAHLFELRDATFVDLSPVRGDLRHSDFYNDHLMPVHTFARVVSRDPIQLAPLNQDWLKAHLRSHPDALRHERVGNEILITAPTSEIQAFLLRNLNTKDAFVLFDPWHRASMKSDTQVKP